jgi:hypothetical protein
LPDYAARSHNKLLAARGSIILLARKTKLPNTSNMDKIFEWIGECLVHVLVDIIAIPIGHALVFTGATVLLAVSMGRIRVNDSSPLQRGFAGGLGAVLILGAALIAVEVSRRSGENEISACNTREIPTELTEIDNGEQGVASNA